jgi:hypothetical protein
MRDVNTFFVRNVDFLFFFLYFWVTKPIFDCFLSVFFVTQINIVSCPGYLKHEHFFEYDI